MEILARNRGRRMVDDAAVEETLRRILASAVFANSPRMSRFLRFVVDETVAGRGGDLKEYVVGLRVFDKPESFNPAVDPTVRVEASKLRGKLARYYELEGQHEPVVVEIPKGHYAARFSLRPRSEVSYGDTVEPYGVAISDPYPTSGGAGAWLRSADDRGRLYRVRSLGSAADHSNKRPHHARRASLPEPHRRSGAGVSL